MSAPHIAPAPRSNAPIFWSLFGAGGMLSALLGPALVFITGVAVPLGLPSAASGIDYAHLAGFARHWAGKGFLFIDHCGNACPSGFLQIPGGNVRTQRLADIYRTSPLFTSLRDPALLTGRCGRCRFAELCGGSRARAYGTTGSYLGDDPLCALTFEDDRDQ